MVEQRNAGARQREHPLITRIGTGAERVSTGLKSSASKVIDVFSTGTDALKATNRRTRTAITAAVMAPLIAVAGCSGAVSPSEGSTAKPEHSLVSPSAPVYGPTVPGSPRIENTSPPEINGYQSVQLDYLLDHIKEFAGKSVEIQVQPDQIKLAADFENDDSGIPVERGQTWTQEIGLIGDLINKNRTEDTPFIIPKELPNGTVINEGLQGEMFVLAAIDNSVPVVFRGKILPIPLGFQYGNVLPSETTHRSGYILVVNKSALVIPPGAKVVIPEIPPPVEQITPSPSSQAAA